MPDGILHHQHNVKLNDCANIHQREKFSQGAKSELNKTYRLYICRIQKCSVCVVKKLAQTIC